MPPPHLRGSQQHQQHCQHIDDGGQHLSRRAQPDTPEQHEQHNDSGGTALEAEGKLIVSGRAAKRRFDIGVLVLAATVFMAKPYRRQGKLLAVVRAVLDRQ